MSEFFKHEIQRNIVAPLAGTRCQAHFTFQITRLPICGSNKYRRKPFGDQCNTVVVPKKVALVGNSNEAVWYPVVLSNRSRSPVPASYSASTRPPGCQEIASPLRTPGAPVSVAKTCCSPLSLTGNDGN